MDSLGKTYVFQSNASKKLFPENNASRFKVKLPMVMHLTEDYAVALKEIHFPLSFKGVKEKYDTESSRQQRSVPIVTEKRKAEEDAMRIPEKYSHIGGFRIPSPTFQNKGLISLNTGKGAEETYVSTEYFEYLKQALKSSEKDVEVAGRAVETARASTDVLSEQCKTSAEKLKDDFEHECDDKMNKCNTLIEKEQEKTKTCEMKKQEEMNQMRDLLRVQRSTIAEVSSSLEEEKKNAEFWRNSYISFTQKMMQNANKANSANIPRYLYIYCDIAEMRFLGDTYANFLHVSRVPPISMSGDTAVDRIDSPQFSRLENHHFDTIEVAIKDERGDEVHFEDGTIVIITLQFKKIR